MVRPLLGALASAVLTVGAARATTIEDLCPSNPMPPDPCVVTANVAVEDSSVIDAGNRTLVIAAGKTVQVEVDSIRVTIRAAKIVLEDGARIFGPASTVIIRATGAPGVSGDIELRGASALDVSNSATYANEDNFGSGGFLDVTAAGDFLADGDLVSAGFGGGEDFDGSGGTILVTAGGRARFNHIDSSGGPNGYFGLVFLEAVGPVTVNGAITMTGGAWSGSDDLVILSKGDVVTNGTINLSVTLPEEAAGPAFIEGDNVTINGNIFARGAIDPYEGYGGFGGELGVEAKGNIEILADVVLPAAAGGEGGRVELTAGGDVLTGSLDLQGPGRYGYGGALEVHAQGAVTLGSIDLSGGTYGGELQVRGTGPVTLGNVNAMGTGPPTDELAGGYIAVASGSAVTVNGNLKARDAASFAGEVSLEGCTIDVMTGADIAAVVAGLTAHEQMTIAGGVHSDASNTFRYRAGGPLPVIVGSVSPAPSLVAAVLSACTSPSVCGNGAVEPPEECDHGASNGTSGDSCGATCLELPPALRVPGGGSRAIDCSAEWSTRLGQVVLDNSAVPRNSQLCTDNDPACDADPTMGTCAFHVWLCLGGDDPRVGCGATELSSVKVLGPAGARGAPARVAVVGALQRFTFPVGPGEQCSGRAVVNVAVRKSVKLKTRAQLTSGKRDNDGLRLKCLAP